MSKDKETIAEFRMRSPHETLGDPTIKLLAPFEERMVIKRIVDRASEILKASKLKVTGFDPQLLGMDITNVHLNGYRLKLWQLLACDGGDFMKDIIGIAKNADRVKGGLIEGCQWRPRFLETIN